jgi:hypothetical protein
MGGFLAELGKKLAERWLSLLVLPGVLYLATLTTGYVLGHRHPFDIGQLTNRLDSWATFVQRLSVSGLVLILLAVLLAAAGAGLVAQALGSLTERVWLADHWQAWPPPLRLLAESRAARRTQRWTAAKKTYDDQLDTTAAQRASHTETSPSVERDQARRRVGRIAQEKPARPTWIGDRIHAVITRLDREYHLDLPTLWPHLWLSMPETTRTEITAARQALTRATTLAGWGLLYLSIGALWAPGVLISAVIVGIAWWRARTAVDTYALLIEAAARLHTTDLARSLGLDHTGPLNEQTGWALTCLLQGKSHLIPSTTGWPASPKKI